MNFKIILIVGLIVFLAVQNVRNKKPSTNLKNIDYELESETIFVAVVHNDTQECIETVESLFSRASCPSRIQVNVYGKNISKYISPQYRDNITSQYDLLSSCRSVPFLIRTLINNTYNYEKYVCIVHSGCLFYNNWDNRCEQLLSSDSDSIITTAPIETHDRSSCFLSLSNRKGMTVRKLIGSAISPSEDVGFSSKLWSSAFTFCTHDVWSKNIKLHPELDNASLGYFHLVMSGVCHLKNIRICMPSYPLIHGKPISLKYRDKRQNKKSNSFAVRVLATKRFQQFAKEIGLRFKHEFMTMTVNGCLGIWDRSNEEEIIKKYGSVSRMNYHRQLILSK